MALSYTEYTGNGSTTDFVLSFTYLSQDYVKVKVDNVATSFTWVNATTVRITPAPASGTTIRIYRETKRDARLVDHQDGTTLTESDLDTDASQMFHLCQEAFDAYQDALNPPVVYHNELLGLGADDHTQYHNNTRGDARYYQKTEFINTSAGAGDADKPIKLDAGGKLDASIYDLTDIDHDSISGVSADDHHPQLHAASHASGAGDELNHDSLAGLSDDDHTIYVLADGTRDITGDQKIKGNLSLIGDSDVDRTIYFASDAYLRWYESSDLLAWSKPTLQLNAAQAATASSLRLYEGTDYWDVLHSTDQCLYFQYNGATKAYMYGSTGNLSMYGTTLRLGVGADSDALIYYASDAYLQWVEADDSFYLSKKLILIDKDLRLFSAGNLDRQIQFSNDAYIQWDEDPGQWLFAGGDTAIFYGMDLRLYGGSNTDATVYFASDAYIQWDESADEFYLPKSLKVASDTTIKGNLSLMGDAHADRTITFWTDYYLKYDYYNSKFMVYMGGNPYLTVLGTGAVCTGSKLYLNHPDGAADNVDSYIKFDSQMCLFNDYSHDSLLIYKTSNDAVLGLGGQNLKLNYGYNGNQAFTDQNGYVYFASDAYIQWDEDPGQWLFAGGDTAIFYGMDLRLYGGSNTDATVYFASDAYLRWYESSDLFVLSKGELHLNGAQAASVSLLRLYEGTDYWNIKHHTTQEMYFQYNGSNKARIDTGGDFFIYGDKITLNEGTTADSYIYFASDAYIQWDEDPGQWLFAGGDTAIFYGMDLRLYGGSNTDATVYFASDAYIQWDESADEFVFSKTISGVGGGADPADQAEMEAGTATNVYVSPGRHQYHPSSAKAWVGFHTSSGTPTIDVSYNVSSLTDVAQGRWRVNFTTSFSSADYAQALNAYGNTSGNAMIPVGWDGNTAKTASSYPICLKLGTTYYDPTSPCVISGVFFGDQ